MAKTNEIDELDMLLSNMKEPPKGRPKSIPPVAASNLSTLRRDSWELDCLLDELGEVTPSSPKPAHTSVKVSSPSTPPKTTTSTPPITQPVLDTESSKCCKCDQSFQNGEQIVEALKRLWHSGCLKCSKCSKTLLQQKIIPGDNGMIYCTNCGIAWLHASGKVNMK